MRQGPRIYSEIEAIQRIAELEHAMDRLTADRDRCAQALTHHEATDRHKNHFLGATSHELRTPLTTIVGYAEFLEDGVGGPLTTTQADFVRQIQLGAYRMQGLLEDLLDFARMESGTLPVVLRPVDLATLLGAELASLRPQARDAHLEILWDETAGPIVGIGDARRLGQVVLNIVGNAIKFTPPGGQISVQLRTEAKFIRVAIADTGIGVTQEHLPHLFETFYQVETGTTRGHGGVGLGLSICKAIITAHGGTIEASSVPGRGTTVTFSVPASLEVVQENRIAPPPAIRASAAS